LLLFADLPGFTRSVYKTTHALISPESHVYGPLPDWYSWLSSFVLIMILSLFIALLLCSNFKFLWQERHNWGIFNFTRNGFTLFNVPS